MKGRSISSPAYRYGYQGQEKDDEIKALEGSSLNYKYRMHDPRLGRFFAIDPLTPDYPHNSPYAFSENRVLDGIELEGLEFKPITNGNGEIIDYYYDGYYLPEGSDVPEPKEGTVNNVSIGNTTFTASASATWVNYEDGTGGYHLNQSYQISSVYEDGMTITYDHTETWHPQYDLEVRQTLTMSQWFNTADYKNYPSKTDIQSATVISNTDNLYLTGSELKEFTQYRSFNWLRTELENKKYSIANPPLQPYYDPDQWMYGPQCAMASDWFWFSFVTWGWGTTSATVTTRAAENLLDDALVHGNSLASKRPTWGYKLYSNNGTFLKNGITSQAIAERRYTKAFMSDKYMETIMFPNRRAAYDWEFQQNLILRGPLNKNMH